MSLELVPRGCIRGHKRNRQENVKRHLLCLFCTQGIEARLTLVGFEAQVNAAARLTKQTNWEKTEQRYNYIPKQLQGWGTTNSVIVGRSVNGALKR